MNVESVFFWYTFWMFVLLSQPGCCAGTAEVKIKHVRSGHSTELVCNFITKSSKNANTNANSYWFYSSSRESSTPKKYNEEYGRTEIKSEFFGETKIVFKQTQRRDSGFYIYRETRHGGQEFCVFQLDVQYGAKANCGNSPLSVNEYSSVTITCSGAGNPVPSLHWYRRATDSKDKENITITGNELILRNVTRYASGYYGCHAVNEVGSDDCEILLNVEFFPSIDVYEDEIILTEKRDVTLICRVTGNPLPGLKWNKGNNTDKIRKNSRYHIYEDKEMIKAHMTKYSLLTLNSQQLRDEMFDVYWCSYDGGFSNKYRRKVHVKDVSKYTTTKQPP